MRIETTPESIRSIGAHYGVNGANLSRQYKEVFSDYRDWKQLGHAEEYILYPQNIGPNLAIDESSLSCVELYTFVTNRDSHGGKGALVATIRGTKAETVIAVLEKIPLARRKTVREIKLDLSSSMMLIARRSFPKATVTNDRFHVYKLYYDAIDELRISLRGWCVTLRTKKSPDVAEKAFPMCRSDMPTVTHENNCWPGQNTS